LFLPVSLIGQPFSQKTRDHFLPLLTSKEWWSDTQVALRRIFEQDSDFKERMFARQIAVMKGQAWNVVETLKTPDHGPLELTRRTRVCVWDDLVDVPVAIPLRSPSAEMRRQQESLRRQTEEDEMDIGSVQRPNGLQTREDLLKFNSGPGSLPSPHRFDLSRTSSGFDTNALMEEPETPATIHGDFGFNGSDRKDFINGTAIRPSNPRTATRVSFEQGHRRVGSYSGRRNSNSSRSGFYYDGDDAEGDLGYAAAQETEKHTRKVIVERLEAVKSKNPVFTWC
jgi:phosphatidylinositol 4-kinase type 2